MTQTNFKIGDKVKILPNFYTKELNICGEEAIVVHVCADDEPKQVRVQVPNRGRFYLLLSEVERV